MKKNTLLVFFLLSVTASFSQNYSIGHRQITWIDSSRGNRPVKTEIYYPAAIAGDDVIVAPNGKKFPVLIFGHGYQLTFSSYQWLKDSLVPKGYFVAMPRTEEVLFPDHSSFARDMAFLATVINRERTNITSWLFGRVLPRYAVSGHSMGGGCALLSVQYSSLINTVIPLAAAETNPSAVAASAGITIPAVIIAGKSDCVTPPSTNQLPMYNNIGGPCKTYIEIDKAKHCHWAVNNSICTLGEVFCGGFSTSPKQTLGTTFSFMLPWLNANLYRKLSELQRFNALLTGTQNTSYQQSCNIESPAVSEKALPLKIFPVPVKAGGILQVQIPATVSEKVQIIINDQQGIKVKEILLRKAGNNLVQVTTKDFRKGIYFITLRDGSILYKSSFIAE